MDYRARGGSKVGLSIGIGHGRASTGRIDEKMTKSKLLPSHHSPV